MPIRNEFTLEMLANKRPLKDEVILLKITLFPLI